MKTFLAKILFFIILFNNSFLNAEINVQAKTAIIQDYLSGKILYEKEADWGTLSLSFFLELLGNQKLQLSPSQSVHFQTGVKQVLQF